MQFHTCTFLTHPVYLLHSFLYVAKTVFQKTFAVISFCVAISFRFACLPVYCIYVNHAMTCCVWGSL